MLDILRTTGFETGASLIYYIFLSVLALATLECVESCEVCLQAFLLLFSTPQALFLHPSRLLIFFSRFLQA